MATIQGVYLALFGRPADPLGLAFFNAATSNGANLTAIGDLAATAEYQTRFTGQSNAQIVTSIFQSLFNREPDLPGLTFFVNALNNKTLNINNIAIAIYDGAQGADKTIRDLKEAAANAFTTAVDTVAEINGYSGAAAAAAGRAFIAGVTTTAPTADAVNAAVLTATTTQQATNGTLTIGTDTLTANVFEAPSVVSNASNNTATLGSTDTLTGNGTNPTLNVGVLTQTTFTAPTLKGIETINLVGVNGGTLDLRNATGERNINASNVTGDTTVRSITLEAGTNGTKLSVNRDTFGGVTNNTFFGFDGASLAGTSDAVTLTLTQSGGAQLFSSNASTLETVNVISNGDDKNGNALGNSLAGAKTLNVEGAGRLTIASLADSVETVDGSKTTNGLRFTTTATSALKTGTGGDGADIFNVSAANTDVTLSLGKGNDIAIFGTTLTAADKADGGDGTDTIVISNVTPAAAVDAKNFETLQIGLSGAGAGSAAGGTYDVSKLTGSTIATVVVKNEVNAFTVDKVASGTKIVLNSTDNADGATTIGNMTVNVNGATAAVATQDVLNIDIGRATTTVNQGLGAIAAGTITANGVETFNINSSGTNSANSINNLVSTTLTKIVVAGDDALTFVAGGIGGNTISEFDASAATGNILFFSGNGIGGATNTGVTIKGGSGNDDLGGGNNNDVISGG